jgi:hypothetical protein
VCCAFVVLCLALSGVLRCVDLSYNLLFVIVWYMVLFLFLITQMWNLLTHYLKQSSNYTSNSPSSIYPSGERKASQAL